MASNQNDILIKFSASGDKKLIKEFKQLSTAQSKFNQETNSSNSSTQRYNRSIAKLRMQFKLKGKSLKEAGVNAELYRRALLGNQRAIERVTIAVQKYNIEQQNANITTRLMTGSLAVARSKMLMFAFATGLLKKPLEDLIGAAARAEATQSQFNVVFRHTSKEAGRFVSALAGNYKRAETDIQSYMATLQDTFVPLGISRVESAKLSASIVQLALDVASFKGAADAQVIEAFQSALVGNHETLKNYSIIIN